MRWRDARYHPSEHGYATQQWPHKHNLTTSIGGNNKIKLDWNITSTVTVLFNLTVLDTIVRSYHSVSVIVLFKTTLIFSNHSWWRSKVYCTASLNLEKLERIFLGHVNQPDSITKFRSCVGGLLFYNSPHKTQHDSIKSRAYVLLRSSIAWGSMTLQFVNLVVDVVYNSAVL